MSKTDDQPDTCEVQGCEDPATHRLANKLSTANVCAMHAEFCVGHPGTDWGPRDCSRLKATA